MGIPRIRNLRHRALERVRHQYDTLEFLDERTTNAPVTFPDNVAVWAALKVDPAIVVAGTVDP